MDTLWIVLAFLFGVVVGALWEMRAGYLDAARRQEQEDPDWFWRGGDDPEWKPYSE